jgi:hypothetical protein
MLTLIGTAVQQRTAGQPQMSGLLHELTQHQSTCTRRAALLSTGAAAAAVVWLPPMRAAFAVDDLAKARTQLSASSAALEDLMRNYDQVVAADGGNGIRRVLGKLGPTSPLYRIDKAVNLVARDLDDDGAFEEVDKFLGQIDAADGDAYSSIFVPTGGGTTPEYWLARSKEQIAKAQATLGRIIVSAGAGT